MGKACSTMIEKKNVCRTCGGNIKLDLIEVGLISFRTGTGGVALVNEVMNNAVG
jgi:hypothetical protein